MNNTTNRSRVLYIVIIAFIVGLAFMMAAFLMNGAKWTANQANQHIYTNGQLSSAGTIYDRNGKALVSTEDGKRVYNSDSTIRKATLHAIGDNSSFIETGAQYVYGSGLSGYSFLNGVYNLKKYNKGNDLYLTLDTDICKTAYNAMDGRKGTVAAYNYQTGEIICMVSTPSYDPENKPSNIDGNSKYEGVYINRFLRGLYTPGSIQKVVTAISAIENIPDIYSQTFKCDGGYNTGDGRVKCNGVHGKVSFEKALNCSCNSAFADIALQLGKDKLTATAEELGFNKTETLDKITISKSTFDISKAAKVDVGWAGIGQYTTQVSPYHMLTIMGAIANGGTAVKPYFVSHKMSPSGFKTTICETEKSSIVNLQPAVAQQLQKLLRSNVVNYYSDSRFPKLQMCGKTGTAEIDNGESHSWFLGYSQRTDLPYAIVCVVENSGSGLQAAGPVVNSVMQAIAKK